MPQSNSQAPDDQLLVRYLVGSLPDDEAERLEAEALAVERGVGGQDTKLEGVVRVTCTENAGTTFSVICLSPKYRSFTYRYSTGTSCTTSTLPAFT